MNKVRFLIAIVVIALAGNLNAQEYYGINIATTKVSSENYTNITGAKISGTISYDPTTYTLTLDNATVGGDITFDTTRIKNITITLIGENTLTEEIRTVPGTKIINGNGSLSVVYLDGLFEKNTIIENCTITVDATTKMYDWAMYGKSSKLTIKNANLSVEGMGVAIGNFYEIELIDCEIVEPANAQIIDNEADGLGGKFICDENGNIAKKVVIKKVTGLNDVAQTNSIDVYPNPAKDNVTIEGKGEIVITNSLGQIVKEVKDNNFSRTLNIKDWESGVYYIKVGNMTQKFVVE